MFNKDVDFEGEGFLVVGSNMFFFIVKGDDKEKKEEFELDFDDFFELSLDSEEELDFEKK